MTLVAVSGRVRPNSGIGVIQRMTYPLLANEFELVEATSRDPQKNGVLPSVVGTIRGAFARVPNVDAYFCLVSPAPLRTSSDTVVVVHDLRWLSTAGRLKRTYRSADLRRVARRAGAIVCVSENTRRELIRRHPSVASRVTVALLGPGVVPDPVEARAGRPGRALIIGPAAHKQNELAAAVLAQMRDRITEVVAINVSPTAQEVLRTSFGNAAHLFGRVSDEELVQHYLDAQYFVHLGTDEGFGLPYVEALRCGCQVIAREVPLTTEVLGEAAVLLRGATVDELVSAWRQQPDRPAEIRAERAARYSWSTFAATVAESLRSVSGR